MLLSRGGSTFLEDQPLYGAQYTFQDKESDDIIHFAPVLYLLFRL